MTVIVDVVAASNSLPTVASVERIEHLAEVLRERTKASHNLGPLKLELEKVVKRVCVIQSSFFGKGLNGLTTLGPSSLQGEGPLVKDLFADHVTLRVHGEELPGSLLFQPAVASADGRRVPRVQLSIALLALLAKRPFSDDRELAHQLTAAFPSADVALVARLRDEMRIPGPLRRESARRVVASAVEVLAPTQWLREKLKKQLRVDDIEEAPNPWPVWWQMATYTGEIAPGTAVLDFGVSTLHARSTALDAVREQWDRHAALLEGVVDVSLQAAFAELVTRRVPHEDVDDARRILHMVVRTGRWPERRDPTRGPINPTEVLTMLRACPETEWNDVLEVVSKRGLTTKENADEVDVVIDALALLMAEER